MHPNQDKTIRIYAEIFSDGETSYTWKEENVAGSESAATLKTAAELLALCVQEERKKGNKVYFIFAPLHDMEIPCNLASRRCVALNPMEQGIFTKKFFAALSGKKVGIEDW